MSVKDEVLKELENNKGDYISGGQLADNLGVSRNSVWKAIKALEKSGYEINAIPNKGYCLAEKNDIFQEIYAFLREYGVRKNERSGIEITVDKHYKQIEMVIEGGFRGISELCLFAPAQKVLLAPSHHFGITFFTQNKSKETETVLSLLENYPNLKYFDFS